MNNEKELTQCGVHGCGYIGACPECYRIAAEMAEEARRLRGENERLALMHKVARDEGRLCLERARQAESRIQELERQVREARAEAFEEAAEIVDPANSHRRWKADLAQDCLDKARAARRASGEGV